MRDSQPIPFRANDNREAAFTCKSVVETCDRTAAALYRKMKRMAYLLLALLICSLTHAQISSGTVVVFQLVNGKFIIAADSRASNSNGTPPTDTYCKIATLGEQFVFARTGAGSYESLRLRDLMKTWDARDDLSAALSKNPISDKVTAEKQVTAIADTWAEFMKNDWFRIYLLRPEDVLKLAKKQNGGLTFGIFALAVSGDIGVTWRRITFTDGIVGSETPPIDVGCIIHPCAAGMTDVVDEYLLRNSKRARAETYSASPEVLVGMGKDMVEIIRLVDLTEAFDKSGAVGGSIDALELSLGGGKRWIQRKNNCPETDYQR